MTSLEFYIDGSWQMPRSADTCPVLNPANGEVIDHVTMASRADVDHAVGAALAAFAPYSRTTKSDRIDLLRAILSAYERRFDDMVDIITAEVGAPLRLSREAQAACGIAHIEAMITALSAFDFERRQGHTRIVSEPVGVCALITPWNWPINQIACKVLPALAAGCTMVLKPSEVAPLNAMLWADILHEAGVPPGVFNLINGDGLTAGRALAAHPDVDMVSFTGSTRAGVDVAQVAAPTIKRVHQELGGKSANIILPDADLETAVTHGVQLCFSNSGQSCDAPTRLLVPRAMHGSACAIASVSAATCVVGSPLNPRTTIGPVVSDFQWQRIQEMIAVGIGEGATLIAGGLGKPDGLESGAFVKPTIFANVDPSMRIVREEIFGPVLVIIPYDDEDEAVKIANDTPYGLAAYVQSGNLSSARRIASQMRAGSVYINYPEPDFDAPFGGFKQSGNGREFGVWGLHEFLEVKAMIGFGDE